MRQIIFAILFLFLFSFSSSAAGIEGVEIFGIDEMRMSNDLAYDVFLKEYFRNKLGIQLVLKEKVRKASPHGHHVFFEQLYLGLPIHRAFVKLNLSLSGYILSIAYHVYDTEKYDGKDIDQKFDESSWMKLSNQKMAQNITEKFFAKEAGMYRGYTADVIEFHPISNVRYEIYDGRIQSQHDMNVYLKDTTIYVKVHGPDPLTSSQTYYGQLFKDSNDIVNADLNKQLKSHSIGAKFNELNEKFLLENDHFRMVDKSSPQNVVPQLFDRNFNYTRFDDEFESVNAFYHLSIFSDYIKRLGFTNLQDSFLDVDALGKLDDNSAFLENMNPQLLIFGEGGVDDAEDADVVIHEYGHYIAAQAAPYSNEGHERKSIDEANCDYFATSYSRNISSFRWNDMFTWDGHNEFWQGRQMINELKYPMDTSTSIHINGTIWAAMMCELQTEIGRIETDNILLQSIYSYYPGMKFKDAGQLLLQADELIYNKKYQCIIEKYLRNRGLLPNDISIPCYDQFLLFDPSITSREVCKNDSFNIGIPNDKVIKDKVFYSWTPKTNIKGYTTKSPIFFGDSGVNYVVTLCDEKGKCNRKNVSISVKSCRTEIEFYNSNGLMTNTGELLIRLPDDNVIPHSVVIFNNCGQQVMSYPLPNMIFNFFRYDMLPVSPGLYFIAVFEGERCKKAIKISKM